jgi:hypothetical protein
MDTSGGHEREMIGNGAGSGRGRHRGRRCDLRIRAEELVMTAVHAHQALDELHRALKEADLPAAEVLQYPQHIAVITENGDFAVWVSPWGRPIVYKVEGSGASYRCGAVRHVVDILRRLTKP